MPVMPQAFGPNMGPLGSNGYQMKNTTPEDVAAQGFWNLKLQQPQLENALQREQMQQDTARQGQQTDFAKNAMATQAGEDTSKMQNQTAQRGQDLNFQLGKMPFDWQREKFGQVFPMFQQAMANFGQGNARVGGENTPTPNVTVGGVYSPQQTEANVHAALAKDAMQTATANRGVMQNAAARGMSSQSPLVQALVGRNQAMQLGTDADAAREIRNDAATGNAKQQTASEALRGQLWAQENQLDINRRQAVTNQQNALLAALAGVL